MLAAAEHFGRRLLFDRFAIGAGHRVNSSPAWGVG
jgi:hypothetical protein